MSRTPNPPLIIAPRHCAAIVARHLLLLVAWLAVAGCAPAPQDDATTAAVTSEARQRAGIVTVSGDDGIAASLTWRVPAVSIADGAAGVADAKRRAAAALEAGDLYADADAAVPLYLALSTRLPDDAAIAAGLQRAVREVLVQGDAALARSDDDIDALREAHQLASVARVVDKDGTRVQAYLKRLDAADQLWELNRRGEAALLRGQFGERGGGALAAFREALALRPKQARAMQGIAAVESAMIRRAEDAAARSDFADAGRWLAAARTVREDTDTVADAVARVERIRIARIASLRDEGVAALAGSQRDGIATARARLAEILRIARPGDTTAGDLRQRIDLAQHYGLFRPGQAFTDALQNGARGPALRVMPHGGFRMGSDDSDPGSQPSERPLRTLRFDRGFAMSVNEVTVAEYGRFVSATGRQTRAARRGFSMVYDERSGNFTRRSGVDWRSGYDGRPAAPDQPVLHVSAKDADAYAAWLSAQSGKRYRLPSEAEFEYVLRAGGVARYPWGNGAPPAGVGNVTGARDRSPSGRRWGNAFSGYGDGAWGPQPVGRDTANAWGLHGLVGNVSEWVEDCWHDNYRRAPRTGQAWINAGCRTRVIRGGSWASSPAQTRSAWRAPVSIDTTNARIGFRVVRELEDVR